MDDKILNAAKEKAIAGERLNFDEILALYRENDLIFLGRAAKLMKERKTGKNVFYKVNRHINLTNVCRSNCPLCAFQCLSGDKRAFTLELPEVEKILQDFKNVKNLSEIHIVGALHPDKNFDYYLNAVKLVRKNFPEVEINAFTPVEIVHFANISGKSFEEVLIELKNAGVNSLPGGGAEIFSERVRKIICPKKATAPEWLEVMKIAHRLNFKTNASMMYGHIETIEERIEHLLELRKLQDETGGFKSMLLFPFHPANTELGREYNLRGPGSHENLKMLALSRITLDNFERFKAFWIMLSMPVAELALSFGADDLDGTIGEEKIIHAAGASEAGFITPEKLNRIISAVGYNPVSE